MRMSERNGIELAAGVVGESEISSRQLGKAKCTRIKSLSSASFPSNRSDALHRKASDQFPTIVPIPQIQEPGFQIVNASDWTTWRSDPCNAAVVHR